MRTIPLLVSIALVLATATSVLAQVNETARIPVTSVTLRGYDVAQIHARAQIDSIHDQVKLAHAYEKGDGVQKDDALAMAWFQRAASYGDAEARYEMGRAYILGRGVPRDPARAADWLLKSAHQGYGPAQVMLGFLYEDGEGVPRDDVQAYAWRTLSLLVPRVVVDQDGRIRAGNEAFAARLTSAQRSQAEAQVKAWKPAPLTPDQQITAAIDSLDVSRIDETLNVLRPLAEAGHVRAQYFLGGMYWTGDGVPKDPETAIVWYQKAAEQGHPHAQHMLGIAYLGEKGVSQDEEKAVQWLRRAADAGLGSAQYFLGLTHHSGRGVSKDEKASLAFLQAAASQGMGDAQYFLGMWTVAANGDPANLVEGYKWLLLAESYGVHDEFRGQVTELKAGLVTKMTAAQITDAEARAAA